MFIYNDDEKEVGDAGEGSDTGSESAGDETKEEGTGEAAA